MIEDGYQNITSIDMSENVINQMTEKYKDTFPQLKFEVADVRKLSTVLNDEKEQVYVSDAYDAIIDKACLDTVLCADYSGPNAKLFLSEVNRVLNDHGVYLSVSYGIPDNRLR